MAQQYGTGEGIAVQMEGPFGNAGNPVKLTEITLPAANWKGAISPYYQVVAVDGASKNSMVDIQPSVEQLEIFHDKDIAFSTENDGGVVTVYAIGDKPSDDYTIQATITEVVA